MTSTLKSLTFTTMPKMGANPVLDRRTKTITRLEEQKALLADPSYARTVRNWVKKDNAMLILKVASNGLTIVYNQEDTNDPASAPPITFQFPNPIKAKCPCESSFASKDIGPVLFNLADVPVIGDIIVSGNRHAIVFGYQTQSGRYETAIPTLLPCWRERDQSKEPDRDDYLFGPVDSIFPVENCVCQ
jgi:hypothetical protein